MLTDWHIGSGAGRPGDVDRLVTRDTDDLPYVPAKTLTGIWRDGCERLAFGLDEGKPDGPWARLVDLVFGVQPTRAAEGIDHADPPKAALLSVRPARLPRALRGLLRGTSARARAFQAALTFVQPGVKIDEKSGRADDDHLRFVEMARGGSKLVADCRLEIEPEFARPAAALLIAGAALVERMGGKRRRGAGSCSLEVLDPDGNLRGLEPIVEWLRANAASVPDAARRVSVPASPVSTPAAEPPVLTGWTTVPLVIELLAPVAVGYRTVGNVLESLDFIPGTYLLPHVTRVLESLAVPARAAIARGDVRVLDATISIGQAPGWRTPICFETRKERDGGPSPGQVRNLLLDVADDDGVQHTPAREGYIGRTGGEATPYVTVKSVLCTHNTVDEEPQRPTEEVGGVYSLQAIAPVQHHGPAVFRSELRLREGLVPPGDAWWKALTVDEVVLGRSKKDDYGRVRLKAEQPRALQPAPRADVQDLFVWARSDVLLCDEPLRSRPSVRELTRHLEARLGPDVKLELVCDGNASTSGKPGNPKAFLRVRRVESWNVRWALPRPTLIALRAGSCARYRVVAGPLDPARLAEIEAAGIGERTAEGFGQVAFNDPLVCGTPVLEEKENENDASKASRRDETALLSPNHPERAAARELEELVWREAIRREALVFAANDETVRACFHWTDRKPPMSQLGALRDALRSLQRPESAAAIAAGWLKSVRDTANRREKWPEAALDAIERLLKYDNVVWDQIQGAHPQEWHTLTEGADSELKALLWALAVRSLVDASVRAHKRRLDEQRAVPAGG
jgi:CRISPR-associated protein Csx10